MPQLVQLPRLRNASACDALLWVARNGVARNARGWFLGQQRLPVEHHLLDAHQWPIILGGDHRNRNLIHWRTSILEYE
jgi:hypothetical protein